MSESSKKVKPKSKRSKQKKTGDSSSSAGSGDFLNRIETSLVTKAERRIDEDQQFEVIDVEEEIELNRKKEKNRKKIKRSKNKLDSVDPRLFPSYHDREEKNDDFDDDELSMDDFIQSSRRNRSVNSISRSNHQIVSVVQGRKLVELCVVPLQAEINVGKGKRNSMNFSKILHDSQREGAVHGIRPHKDVISFSSPIRLLEIEDGRAILVNGTEDTNTKSRTTMTVVAVKETMTAENLNVELLGIRHDGKGKSLRKRIADGQVREFEVAKPEKGGIDGQKKMRRLLVSTMDDVNALALEQKIQLWIPFLSGYESYLLGQLVEVLGGTVSGRKARRRKKTEFDKILRFAFQNQNLSRVIIEDISGRWDFSSHWFQKVSKSRWFGITKFPATENLPAPVDWTSKFWKSDLHKIIAQSVLSECNGIEATSRNLCGTYVGRMRANEFRTSNRISVDESVVHSFVIFPIPTMKNNGVVHVLRQMEKHWRKILSQPFGDFAHHRLEQIDPFETMRFHMPNVCIVLASLRGWCWWDSHVLGPFIRKCQVLTISSTANECLELADEMQKKIIPNVCAGVIAIENPLSRWLEAIKDSCHMIEEKAKEIYLEVTGVEVGIRFGHDLITQVSWKIPSDEELEKAILLQIHGKYSGEVVHERKIRKALLSTTPRDKRTLIELYKLDQHSSKPAKVLLRRVKNLLKREIRRGFLNEAIRELSSGEPVLEDSLRVDDWYWLNEDNDKKSVYIFQEEEREDGFLVYRFVRADSGMDAIFSSDELEAAKCRRYIPVAESIVRAQRCFMNIELDHCQKFKYYAFAEFSFLRTALNRLAVISQIFCEDLDVARLNLLHQVKELDQVKVGAGDLEKGNTYYIYSSLYDVYAPFVCKKKYSPADPEWQKLQKVEMVSIPPQSLIVVGSDITGLMTAIHCAESVLASGGEIKLCETFDANTKERSVFQRAQIVRLDPRWVAMLRYHLGTGFEDTFIPLSGNLHAHLGNNLVTQGFVETTIKDLECILHAEVTRLWSKELIGVSIGSKVHYDAALNSLVKLGENLEVGDKLLRHVNPMGKTCKELHRWTVVDVQNADTLGIDDLFIGEEYDVYDKEEKTVLPFKVTDVDLETRTYKFESIKKKGKFIDVTAYDLPLVYPKGSKRHFKTVSIRCQAKGDSEDFYCDRLSQTIIGEKFVIDIGHCHVVECMGKPPCHFQVTSSEPYGFCCISRFHRLMGRRGILDGFRLKDVQEDSKIVGGSVNIVEQHLIAQMMVTLIHTENWQLHFINLIENSNFSSLNDKDPIVVKLMEAVEWHDHCASSFRRKTLQIKISETTDNFYLGMEMTREYDKWKKETVDHLLLPIDQKEQTEKESELNGISEQNIRNIEEFKELLRHNLDLLWFEACLEVMHRSGIYDSDVIYGVPRFQLINSYIGEELKHLSVGDCFRVAGKVNRKFEILFKRKSGIFARNSEGIVRKFDPTVEVFREGCLTRKIDGDAESAIAIATFDESQYINHQTVCPNNVSKGYIFASAGDEQSNSHFLHYSALSGGCINAMQINQFLRSAIEGVPFLDRLRLYSKQTNWSNWEAVQRGVMTSFGQDAFLRPGFSYEEGLKYVRSQVIEAKHTFCDVNFHSLKTVFAASMIPRGMELNNKFLKTLKDDTSSIIFDLYLEGVMDDEAINWSDGLQSTLIARRDEILSLRVKKNQETFWEQYVKGLATSLDDVSQRRLEVFHGDIAKEMEQFVCEVIDFAKEGYLYNLRSSQELWNQPKPVDSIVDDFAAGAQNLPNSLAQSVAFCTVSVILGLYSLRRDDVLGLDSSGRDVILAAIGSVIISMLNVFVSFRTILNSRKYRARNEHALAMFLKKHFLDLKKSVYCFIDTEDRKALSIGKDSMNFSDNYNPFLEDLEEKKGQFVEVVFFYGLQDPEEFITEYRALIERNDQPAALKHFQKLLVTHFIPNVYQTNSYVQESLVEVYKVCDEIHTMLSGDKHRSPQEDREKIFHLFDRIFRFGPRLQNSLNSRLLNSDILLAIRCMMGLNCCSIKNETYMISKEVRILSETYKDNVLKRQNLDLEYLYRATLEAEKNSLVFFSASLIFIASFIFAASIIVTMIPGNGSVFTKVGFWWQLSSIFAAIVSFLYFVRHLSQSFGLLVKLGAKTRAQNLEKKSTYYGLRRIKGYTFMQLLLTLIRSCVVLCSFVALSWCVVANAYPSIVGINESVLLYIGLAIFCLVIGTEILFYAVEYTIGFILTPKLGEIVCEAFREEIETIHEELSVTENKLDTKQSQERITWEYVARDFLHRFRFDSIFRTDRFSSILQYLQCGMEKREEHLKADY